MIKEHIRILEEVSKSSIDLLLKEPFYSHFFSTLNKEVVSENSNIETMAVGLSNKSFVLYINPVFWDNKLASRAHRYGVIKHEVLHLVFKHLIVYDSTLDQRLLNIAMDLVVNQYIESNQLPEGSILLSTFPELNLFYDQTHIYYYEKLNSLLKDIESKQGLCDSISAKNLNSISIKSNGLERHRLWDVISKLGKTEKSVLDYQINNLLNIARNKTSLKSYGELPAGVKLYLDNIFIKEEQLVNWKRILKLFSESSSKTYLKNTLKRPSRRYGTNPGIKIKRKQKLLVAIDTSGSIDDSEYTDFFSELLHIYRTGAEIRVVECDARIQNKYDFKGIAPKLVHGGGGTSFDPPIKYVNTEFECDGLIYFTDGIALSPTLKCRSPILWVISKHGLPSTCDEFKILPGRKAKMI